MKSRRAADLSAQADPDGNVRDLVFMGTPAFAAAILGALIDAGHAIRAVYTQPSRPAGRGHRLQPSPVQRLAASHGLVLRVPASLRDAATQAEFAAFGADAGIVAAYGLILPAPMLTAPRLGCLNVHASLLPRWRGAAPVQRALLAGDRETGITIMQMAEGLDTGAILLQRVLPIAPGATAASLTEALAALGGRLIVEALAAAGQGRLVPRPQPEEGATYARKIGRDEARLDWRLPAAELERCVRAFDPRPGAFFDHQGEPVRVLAAAVVAPGGLAAMPGTVLDERPAIACGAGILRLLRLQRPGRTVLDAADFLRGYPIPPGTRLPCRAIGS
jgi:methionyl-tRNA formyltransferase